MGYTAQLDWQVKNSISGLGARAEAPAAPHRLHTHTASGTQPGHTSHAQAPCQGNVAGEQRFVTAGVAARQK